MKSWLGLAFVRTQNITGLLRVFFVRFLFLNYAILLVSSVV